MADSLSCGVILWQLKWKLSLKIHTLIFCYFTIWDGFDLLGLHDLNVVFGLQLWTYSIKQTQKIDSPFGHKMTTYIDISVSSIASNTRVINFFIGKNLVTCRVPWIQNSSLDLFCKHWNKILVIRASYIHLFVIFVWEQGL